MLVLTRRPEEGDKSAISIGSDVEVTLLEIRGDQVRIGITAPDNVPVHRREVWLKKKDEGQKPCSA